MLAYRWLTGFFLVSSLVPIILYQAVCNCIDISQLCSIVLRIVFQKNQARKKSPTVEVLNVLEYFLSTLSHQSDLQSQNKVATTSEASIRLYWLTTHIGYFHPVANSFAKALNSMPYSNSYSHTYSLIPIAIPIPIPYVQYAQQAKQASTNTNTTTQYATPRHATPLTNSYLSHSHN